MGTCARDKPRELSAESSMKTSTTPADWIDASMSVMEAVARSPRSFLIVRAGRKVLKVSESAGAFFARLNGFPHPRHLLVLAFAGDVNGKGEPFDRRDEPTVTAESSGSIGGGGLDAKSRRAPQEEHHRIGDLA